MADRPYKDKGLYDLYDLAEDEDPKVKAAAQAELKKREEEQKGVIAQIKTEKKATEAANKESLRYGNGGRRSRKLRLYVKRRGTKRHLGRSKHRKLRKLTARRR